MKVCGIKMPENATFEFFGSPYGLDLSRNARLYVYTDSCRPIIYHITELESDLTDLNDENDLGAEKCFIEFVENQNGNQDRAYAQIVSGNFKGTSLVFKIEKWKN